MAIRKRFSAGKTEEVSDEVNLLKLRAGDSRGVFNPASDPTPGSIVERTAMGAEPHQRRSIVRAVAHSASQQGKQHDPRDMRVQDLLALVRIPEDNNSSIEDRYRDRINSPLSAIRAKCLDCQAYSVNDIRECYRVDCALWPFRMGTNGLRGAK
jgi:hypothetical protein